MKYKFLLFFFYGFSIVLRGGDPIASTRFTSPVKHTLILAGSFGEIRYRHFHAGLDIKSRHGGEGDSIFSSEQGFVSKIKILRGGYGKVLYIDHPNGYTTVYAHLKGFREDIEQYVNSIQINNQSYEIDIVVDSALFVLRQGEHIAFLGNTGRSSGPHLHFEIRETQSDLPMNPLLFGIKPNDDKEPLLIGVSAAGLDERYHKIDYNYKSTKKDKAGNYIPLTFEIEGDIAGIAINAHDKNNGSNNRNGLYRFQMFVDDILYYGFNINAFSFSESHVIEAHTDYEIKQKTRRTEILCYKLPGNYLSIIDYHFNNGIIPIELENPRIVKLLLSDFEGNTITQIITLKKKKSSTQNNVLTQSYISCTDNTCLKSNDLMVTIYDKSLPKDLPVSISVSNSEKNKKVYSIGTSAYPILQPIRLAIKIPDEYRAYADKLGFMLLGKDPDSFGQEISGDSLITYTDDFGRYGFIVDSIPPSILPQNFSNHTAASAFKFRLSDNIQTRYKAMPFQYHVYIDNVWIPCEYKEGNKTLTIPIKNLISGEHHLKIETIDQFSNRSEWQAVFTYQQL